MSLGSKNDKLVSNIYKTTVKNSFGKRTASCSVYSTIKKDEI